ncbi:MAG: pyruvate dehydrogenase (acetyl-transferring) E1 component subunit alpha [Nocardioidaceae bacterium]
MSRHPRPGTTDAGPGPAGLDGVAALDAAAKHRLDLLRDMTRVRVFEERCVELYSAAKIRGFLHVGIGEEAVAVGVCSGLDADDAVVSTYREHGHALAKGVPMDAVMAEMFGKVTGCSHGRGGSMHLFDVAHRFYGGNAIVGGGLPVALGLALADKMRGRPAATACFFGDGAYAEGEFHECANLAALWRLPLLLCCENNLYAMGTAIERAQAETDLALRAASYGMASWAVDGMDVLAVEEATRWAVDRIRGGGGPCFLELRTYRFRAHSMYDPELYRDKAEVRRWRERDPLELLAKRMLADSQLDAPAREALTAEVGAEVDRAADAAEQAAFEPVEDLTRFVHSEPSGRSVARPRTGGTR